MSARQRVTRALAQGGNQPEGSTVAQFHVRDLHAVLDAADDETSFAPVGLKGFAIRKRERHECLFVAGVRRLPATALPNGVHQA